MPCRLHPFYKGVLAPRLSCGACWKYFFDRNPGRIAAVQHGLETFGRSTVEAGIGAKTLRKAEKFMETKQLGTRH